MKETGDSMFQIELKIGTRRNVVLLALAGAIALGPTVCNAQTSAQPAANPFDQFDVKPSKPKKDSAASPKKDIVVQALERGYSIDEIADRIAKYEGIDPAILRERGYSSEGMLTKFGYSVPKPPSTEGVKKEASPRKDNLIGLDAPRDTWIDLDTPRSVETPGGTGGAKSLSQTDNSPSGLFDDLLKPKPGTADAVSDAMATKQQNRPVGGASNFVGPVVSWVLLILGLIGYFKMRSGEKKIALESLPANKLVGIHGWLRFFVISLGILGPALSLGKVGVAFRDAEMVYSVLINSSEWSTYKTTVWLTLAAFLSFSIYAALELRFVWKPASVTLAKTAVASWPVANLLMGVVIPRMVFPGKSTLDAEFVGSFLALIVSTVIWITYLSKSKRVRATYYGSLIGTQPLTDERPDHASWKLTPAMDSMAPRPGADKAGSASNVETDDRLYEKAATPIPIGESAASIVVPPEEFWSGALAEFDSASRRSGLYARAFAEAQGNEATTKANYLRYRAGELAQEYQLQVAERQHELAQEEAQRVRKLEEAQAVEAQRIYLSLPKGRCPNSRCKAVIPLASQKCPKCAALFEVGSTWSVRPLEP